MAENILYSRPEASSVHVDDEFSGKELNKEIQEMDISEGNSKVTGSKCELCVVKNPLFESMAVFLCFICEMYVCVNCMPDHRLHKGMKVGNKESESDKKEKGRENNKMGEHGKNGRAKSSLKGLGKYPKGMRLEESKREREWEKKEDMENTSESERKRMRLEESKREREWEKSEDMENTSESERKRMQLEESKREREWEKSEDMENTSESESNRILIEFVDELIHESEIERKEKLKASHVNIYDRVEVKHELDEEDCNITGLCGLENKRWVVCDYGNFCIKIFKLGSNVLQRYIRFDSQPWDVTEILEKQNSTTPYPVPGSISGTSVTAQTEQDKNCLIAVTLTWKRQIMFVALHKKPALAHKIVYTETSCYSILHYNDKIFTVGREDLSPCSVYIKSTDGDTLYKFSTDITFYVPHLAVISGRVYLAYRSNDKVQCRADDGQVISENIIERSRPEGISVDKDSNCTYVHYFTTKYINLTLI